jgi:vWA-MoxR associated protein C-terminal domain/vWA-MoxR associated protein middle region 0/Effector-associated domain 2
MGASVRISAKGGAGIGVVEALVDTLAEAGLASDSARRMLLLELICAELGQRLMIPDQSAGRDHLIEIVSACAKTTGAMLALVRAFRVMRPDSPAYDRIRHLVEEPQVLDVLPAADLAWLRERLAKITVLRLPVLIRRAAGPGAHPALVGAEADAWDAFSYLLDINAGPDGIPPPIRFVELLADQIGGELGAELGAWNGRVAHQLNLDQELREMRSAGLSAVVTDSPLHLLISIRPDSIDPRRYLVSHWRQDDPDEWPPPCGGTQSVLHDELELAVDQLVTDSEIAWSSYEGPVALEFALPRSLLNLPVHLWQKEYGSGDPRPLCFDYPVVVRSLERMQNAHWHRVWRRRWQSLLGNSTSAAVHFARAEDTGEPHRLDALLADPRLLLMVLSAPPAAEALPGGDELAIALRSGLPVLIWAGEGQSPDALQAAVEKLIEKNGLTELPSRVQARRQAVFRAGLAEIDLNLLRSLVVLFDNPHRLVAVDTLHPAAAGGTA